MAKFVSLPYICGEFVVNADYIISIKEIDGFGAVIFDIAPFKAVKKELDILPPDGVILTKLSYDDLKALLEVK